MKDVPLPRHAFPPSTSGEKQEDARTIRTAELRQTRENLIRQLQGDASERMVFTPDQEKQRSYGERIIEEHIKGQYAKYGITRDPSVNFLYSSRALSLGGDLVAAGFHRPDIDLTHVVVHKDPSQRNMLDIIMRAAHEAGHAKAAKDVYYEWMDTGDGKLYTARTAEVTGLFHRWVITRPDGSVKRILSRGDAIENGMAQKNAVEVYQAIRADVVGGKDETFRKEVQERMNYFATADFQRELGEFQRKMGVPIQVDAPEFAQNAQFNPSDKSSIRLTRSELEAFINYNGKRGQVDFNTSAFADYLLVKQLATTLGHQSDYYRESYNFPRDQKLAIGYSLLERSHYTSDANDVFRRIKGIYPKNVARMILSARQDSSGSILALQYAQRQQKTLDSVLDI